LRDNLRIDVNQLILGELLLFELDIEVKHLLNFFHGYISLVLVDQIFLGLVPLHNLSKDTVKLLKLNLCFIHEFQSNHREHSCGSEAVLSADGILALVLEVEIQFVLGDEHLNNLLADQVKIIDSLICLISLLQGLNARDEVHVHLESALDVVWIHVQQNEGQLDALLQQLFVFQFLNLERLRFFFG